MAYQLTQGANILRTADNAFIPPDPTNIDYAAYLAWVDEGNTPTPAPAPQPPTPLTARERLEAAGFNISELRELLFADA